MVAAIRTAEIDPGGEAREVCGSLGLDARDDPRPFLTPRVHAAQRACGSLAGQLHRTPVSIRHRSSPPSPVVVPRGGSRRMSTVTPTVCPDSEAARTPGELRKPSPATDGRRRSSSPSARRTSISPRVLSWTERRLGPSAPCRGAATAVVTDWLRALLIVVNSTGDCPTIDAWTSRAGVSRTTLCSRCRLVGASPRDSLAFVRLARAVLVADGPPWRPEDVLDTREERTLERLLTRGGLLTYRHRCPPALGVLFACHRFRLPAAPLRGLQRLLEHARGLTHAPPVPDRSMHGG